VTLRKIYRKEIINIKIKIKIKNKIKNKIKYNESILLPFVHVITSFLSNFKAKAKGNSSVRN